MLSLKDGTKIAMIDNKKDKCIYIKDDSKDTPPEIETTPEKKLNLFKSFIEISPSELILQAGQRQQFIDQSQSLNLMIHPSVSAKDINKLYLNAHESGVKTLYYQFSQSSAQSFSRNILECASCEG